MYGVRSVCSVEVYEVGECIERGRVWSEECMEWGVYEVGEGLE